MKKYTVKKWLLAGGMTMFSLNLAAWSVPEGVIEISKNPVVTMEVPIQKPLEPRAIFETGYMHKPTEIQNMRGNEFIFQKTPAKLTSSEKTSSEYRRALQCLQRGEESQAESVLISIVNRMPAFHTARQELAALYLRQNELDDSEAVLLDGLKLKSNHAGFLRLLAMIHDRREDPQKALALLVKVPEKRKSDKAYVAFLAHVYQQMGQYNLARQQYFRLLQAEPRNPLWLLGISIAMDSEGQHDEALEGYQRLIAGGNVDASILQYAKGRIKFLKG